MTQTDWVAAAIIVLVSAVLAAMLSNVLGAVPYDPDEGGDDDDEA